MCIFNISIALFFVSSPTGASLSHDEKHPVRECAERLTTWPFEAYRLVKLRNGKIVRQSRLQSVTRSLELLSKYNEKAMADLIQFSREPETYAAGRLSLETFRSQHLLDERGKLLRDVGAIVSASTRSGMLNLVSPFTSEEVLV